MDAHLHTTSNTNDFKIGELAAWPVIMADLGAAVETAAGVTIVAHQMALAAAEAMAVAVAPAAKGHKSLKSMS